MLLDSLSSKQPNVLLPITMASIAPSIVLIFVGLDGITRKGSKGTAARIFQVLMLIQIPIVGFFAFNWIPHRPMRAIRVLGFQPVAGFSVIAAVSFFG